MSARPQTLGDEKDDLRLRTETVNMRVRSDVKQLIDRVARAQGKSRSQFMIEAARQAAQDHLMDNVDIRLSQEDYDWFVAVLDKGPGPGFEEMMNTKAPWDK